MAECPDWVSKLIEKGGAVSECMGMLDKIEQIKIAENERKERAEGRTFEKTKLEYAMKMRELDVREKELAKPNTMSSNGSPTVKVSLPKYVDGEDIEVFLRSFERLAYLHKWDKSDWPMRLIPQLSGKALEAYARMSVADSNDYDQIKQAILQRFGLNAWAYREKYRHTRQESGESFREYAVRVSNLLEHWVESEKVEGSYDNLYDLVRREQLLFSAPMDLQVWLRERQPETSEALIGMAEAFQLAHQNTGTYRNRVNPRDSYIGRTNAPAATGTGVYVPPHFRTNNKQTVQEERDKTFIRRCYYCKSPEHILPNCPERKGNEDTFNRGKGNDTKQTNALLLSPRKTKFSGNVVTVPIVSREANIVEKDLENGLKVVEGTVNGKRMWALRDTGCTTVFVSPSYVDNVEDIQVVKQIRLANGNICECPEVEIELDTPYLKGRVVALVMDSPVADVIIGNVGHVIDDSSDKHTDSIQLVETRAVKQIRETTEQLQREREEEILDGRGKFDTGKAVDTEEKLSFPGVDDLEREQQSDKSLENVRKLAVSEDEKIDSDKPYFKQDQSILCRYFKTKSGEVIKQIVVPLKYRTEIMHIAHDPPMGGHLGNRKTRLRVLKHFYWPGIFKDVAVLCRACPECQKSIAKGRVSKAPLVPVPPIDIPFKRIALDIVGPLTRTKQGNKYILVICDYATKYPEAVPMKTIDAEAVANELIWFISRVGIPQEILTDMGSNFNSALIKELCRLLKVHKLFSSPYHPQANGLVENFNGTLKKMLRCYSQQKTLDWDVCLPYVLFAYREVPQETTGYSPFDLLYTWPVRGPLSVLYEMWDKPEDKTLTPSVLEFVLQARERLQTMTEIANEKERKAKGKQKLHFDKKAKMRTMQSGDKALVLLPTATSKLLAQWKGPYKVIEKVGDVNYIIEINRKRKLFHINMLKQWYERETCEHMEPDQDIVQSVLEIEDEEGLDDEVCDYLHNPPAVGKESVDKVKINVDLDAGKQKQLRDICDEFQNVLSDIPGRTSLVQHDVKVMSEWPVHKKPYPLPYAIRDSVKQEIDNMINTGIVEASTSPWAAPLVIVPKKDNSLRLCVDYRGLNEHTIFDPQPMPKIDEILNKLGRANFMSKIDLTKGYWQIPLTMEAKEKSAFVCPFGHYQFTVMPFGMTNSAASFVRLMKEILKGKDDFADSFIDDIIVYSETWDTHVRQLRQVFVSLQEAKVTAKPSKCYLGFQEMEFLAHVVGFGEVKPTNEKVQAVDDIAVPTTKRKVRAFIGFMNFYRRFIPNFAEIAAPLTDLTAKKAPNKVVWRECHQLAFESLKKAITSYPVLHNPDFTKDFILQTDSSDRGIGAVLLQEVEGNRHPILYVSKKLLAREQAYSTIEKECLAIVRSVVALKEYLYGKKFYIETDHFPLQWLHRMKGQNQRLLRWSLMLQEYRYEVTHVPGRKNTVADMLSRC